MAIDITTLNDSQRKAVTHREEPVMILAGAGTGKTTVITNRIAWLIAEGKAKPEEVLAVVGHRLLPLGYTQLWIHTFHAFCQRVLEDHALAIGLPNKFILLDTTAVWLLMRRHLDRFDLDYYKPLSNPTRFIHAMIQHQKKRNYSKKLLKVLKLREKLNLISKSLLNVYWMTT